MPVRTAFRPGRSEPQQPPIAGARPCAFGFGRGPAPLRRRAEPPAAAAAASLPLSTPPGQLMAGVTANIVVYMVGADVYIAGSVLVLQVIGGVGWLGQVSEVWGPEMCYLRPYSPCTLYSCACYYAKTAAH